MKHKYICTLALLFAHLQTFAQTYSYDNLNRLKKVVYENGTTVTYSYDALGNRTSKKVTSNSVIDEFTVSVTAIPVQGGTVFGGGTYTSGTTIELVASPNEGYEFVEWNDGVTDNPRTVTVTRDITYTAQFLATGFTTDWAQKVILYMRNDRVYEYGVPELTDISFNDRKQQLTVSKTNNQQDEYSVLLMDSIAFIDGEIENDEHEYVDLGLPSGTLWATCNIGASAPEESGGLFAWGETETKETYNWESYKWCSGSVCNANNQTLTKYGVTGAYGVIDNKTILEANDDAATVLWGSSWCIPTDEQFQELIDNTDQEWKKLNSVKGYFFIGINGNSIFIPECDNEYWTSSLRTSGGHSTNANVFEFNNTELEVSGSLRYRGLPVRPVRKQ